MSDENSKVLVEIKSRWDGSVLYSAEVERDAEHPLREVVARAIREKVNLSGSNLRYSNLRYSNLSGSNLSGSDLSYSNLRYSDLSYSDLSYSDLSGSNLSGSNLSGSNLRYSNLRYSNLSGSNLSGSGLSGSDLSYSNHLPAPSIILSGQWGVVPDDLCVELMRWDAANHPDPTAFDRWAAGGACPYDGVKFQRAAQFKEKRELWSPGPSLRPYDLAMRLMEWAKGNYDKLKDGGAK